MGSKVLPQALHSIPRTPKNLGFSTLFPCRLSSFNSNSIAISRVPSTKLHFKIAPIITQQSKRSVFVRAESNSEGEEATPENAEALPEVQPEAEIEAVAVTEAEGEVEVEAEAEVKPSTPRKPQIKLGDIMGILNKRAVEAAEKERPVPDLRTGDIVEIKLEVPENRRRASTYKGIVISKQNAGIHTTIRIRRIIAGIGVEIVFPVYSPNIKEIKVVKHRKVRRARLYYLRDKLPRFSTFK